MAPTLLHVVGGATLRGSVSLRVSWSLARLELDETGLRIHTRFLLFGWAEEPKWSATWDQIAPVVADARTTVLTTRDGQASCRFVAMRPSQVDAVLDRLEERGVSVRRTKRTFRYFYVGGRPPTDRD